MKIFKTKSIFFGIATALVVLSSLPILQSCSKDDDLNMPKALQTVINNPNEFRVLNRVYPLPIGKRKWEAQLDKIIENDSILSSNGLILEEYNWICQINTNDDLDKYKSICNSNVLVPTYKMNSMNFTLEPKIIKNNQLKEMLDVLLPSSILNNISSFSQYEYNTNNQKDKFSVVKVKWNYKGNILYTICFVSDLRGIVYDDFLFYITQKFKSTFEKTTNIRRNKRFKTAANDTPTPTISDVDVVVNINESEYNYIGLTKYAVTIYCFAYYHITNQIKYFDYEKFEAKIKSDFPYSCAADVRTTHSISGPANPKPGETGGSFEYYWAYTYRFCFDVTLSWNGAGFNFGGGSTNYSGGGTYRP